MAVTAQKSRRGDVRGQVYEIVVLRLFGQEQGALSSKVAGLHGQDAPAAGGAVAQNLRLHQLKAAVGVAQEDQAQHGHAVLVGGQLRPRPQQICRFPEFGFQFTNTSVVHISISCFSYIQRFFALATISLGQAYHSP